MGEEARQVINLMEPGHTGCAGCGQAIAARLVLKAAGPRVIVANATGCLEVYSATYPRSSWEVPWIHSLFENAAAGGEAVFDPFESLRFAAFGGGPLLGRLGNRLLPLAAGV